MLKMIIKKLIPKSLLLFYHKLLAVLANVIYRFPSRKMVVIGVTGTKGKSSTVVMITRILEAAGFKVGSTNTIFFKIGAEERVNNDKQGMPGRLRMQKLLRKMVNAGCTHAVIEVTSEGVAQSRHWGIAFDIAVFTNLSPEHIESHGSFANYRSAKAQIFRDLRKSYYKKAGAVKKVIVVNRLDAEAEYFLHFRADEKWSVWGVSNEARDFEGEKKLAAQFIKPTPDGISFQVDDCFMALHLHGEFMAANALLAIAAANSLGVSLSAAKQGLESIESIPGRVEIISAGAPFTVVIDYAHEPKSLEAILRFGRARAGADNLIAVFGVTGGGRDQAKRPVMGALAARYADQIILTTDDPYNDDPDALMADIVPGITKTKPNWQEGKNWWRQAGRKQAIKQALRQAQAGDVVLVLGKGSETVMAIGGKVIPWSDSAVVEEWMEKES